MTNATIIPSNLIFFGIQLFNFRLYSFSALQYLQRDQQQLNVLKSFNLFTISKTLVFLISEQFSLNVKPKISTLLFLISFPLAKNSFYKNLNYSFSHRIINSSTSKFTSGK